MNETMEALTTNESAVAFVMNENGDATIVVHGEESLVMYSFVQLIKDLAEQDSCTFDEALEKIRYYHNNCEISDKEGSSVERIRAGFKLIDGKKDIN